MDAQQAWQAALGQFQMDMPKASYDTWVRDSRFISHRENTITIGVNNAYARDWLESRLKTTAERLLTSILGCTEKLVFVVNSAEEPCKDERQSSVSIIPDISSRQVQKNFNTRYTFESFVVGPNSRLAHAASQAVAENPAKAYNPLFLYGGVGLGKTHLLHAIGNEAAKNNQNILYVSSEEFTNDLINAIRRHDTASFRDKYRTIDVLLIDDIQFIAGKESTQEEFFHTFNTLHGQDKQIVISSDRPPKAMVTLEERLRSRFEWGLIVDIQPPELETRIAILRFKAEQAGRVVPDEILESVAKKIQSNIRELEGALTRILAFSDLSGRPLTLELANLALVDFLPDDSNPEPAQVMDTVARAFNISNEELLSRNRSRKIALPRQVAMYLMREMGNASLPQIGETLGGRDHTTVLYACEKVADMIERDEIFRRQVHQIRDQIFNAQVYA
ncbi:MAG: chromosomal replication initiator protein DnaA [Anaerolineaceae bacterium]|nr:chromosomal replication initiator protein DnaA [Anaerolineaceae bacterium]